MKLKRVLVFILLAMVSFSGMLFGCQNKYDNMKLTSNRDETGLQLYLGEDSDLEDGAKPSIGTITFTISGVGGDVSKKLKYNYDASIVKILNEEIVDNVTTLTLQAISGGSTKFIAITEEGSKTNSVDVDCIRRITDLKFNDSYKPAIFNRPDSSLVINSKQIIFNNGDLEGTTQNEVVYSLKNTIDGVELTSGGLFTLTKAVNVQDIVVVATSVFDARLSDEVNVHLINVIDEDNIDIVSLSPVYKNGEITLTTDGDESNVTLDIDVETSEVITLYYKLKENEQIASSSTNCVTVEQNINEFHMYADSIGNCLFEIEVHFSNYSDAPVVKKIIPVNVVKLPNIININGKTTDFSDDIFTYYQNGLGKQYIVTIGDLLAYNKQFVIVADSNLDFNIKKSDGSSISYATLQDGNLSGEYDILQTGNSIFVSGNIPNQSANLYIYAYGSLGYSRLLVRKLSLTTLLGSTTIEPDFSTLDGETTSTYYVEVGKSFELNYSIDENSSAKGIRLLNADGSEINTNISVNIGSGVKPIITITGIQQGTITCKLVLANLLQSVSFDICAFVPVQYDDEDALSGGYKLSIDSPLQNKNIAEANYIYGSLTSFVLSIGTGTQLNLSTQPNNATIYSAKYSSVVIIDGDDEIDGSTYATISRTGYIAAKKVLPQSFVDENDENINHVQKLYIVVELVSLSTQEDGSICTVVGKKYVEMEVYVPLTNVVLSKTSSTIYWEEGLNIIQKENGSYLDYISMSFYPNAINLSKVKVNYDINLPIIVNNENHSVAVSAIGMPENVPQEKVYTLTITIQYYSTIIVRRATFNVIKPIKAEKINAYIDDIEKYVAYFDVSESFDVEKIKINTAVYSDEFKQNVTFPNVYYSINDRDRYIASVDKDGYITPLGVGTCEIKVYAEDMIAADGSPTMYKTIYVVVADGKSYTSALRIRSEGDFEKINADSYYYFSSDVKLSKEYHLDSFNGNIQGNGFNLQNVQLNQYSALFGELTTNAQISNLNIYFGFNKAVNSSIEINGLASMNNGRIESVNAYYSTASVEFMQGLSTAEIENIDLRISGLAGENNGVLSRCTVYMNLEIINNSEHQYHINELLIGGLAITNNNYISGSNNNYRYYSQSFVQDYEYSGKIFVTESISAQNSAIGGICAINNYYETSHFVEELQEEVIESFYGVIGGDNNGVATEVIIDAKNIDNVGGIAGINKCIIKNVLVYADILARNNIGGVCGIAQQQNESIVPEINNAIVELYEDVSNRGYFNNISGKNYVGGLIGYAQNISVHNSYIKSYADGCFVKANITGGLIGFADATQIESCYVDANIESFNESTDVIGGIVGEVRDVIIDKAYFIGVLDGTQKGIVFGEVKTSQSTEKTLISQFYSNAGQITEFVGIGDAEDYTITQSYGTESNLQSIDTYYFQDDAEKSWKFYDAASDSFDWYINEAKNNGYPILVFNDQYLMQKDMPTEIYVSKANQDIKDIDGLIIINSNQSYLLNEILQVSTNVNSRVNIYVYCDKNGILSTNNINNRLTAQTSLYSSEEQVITLTFVLGNNADITKKVQIAFIKEVLNITVDDIDIKKGENAFINAYLSYEFDKTDNYIFEEVSQKYVLGFDRLNLDSIEEFIVLNSFNMIYNQGEEDEYTQTLFKNKSILMSVDSFDSQFDLNLYYVLTYQNLDGQEIVEYIPVSSYQDFSLTIYTGATSIQISNSNIDMTIIDDITFTVTLNTDKKDDILIIENDANYIFANINSTYIQVSNGSINDAKLILSIIEGPEYDYDNNQLVITFDLKFKDEYLSSNLSTSFNKILNSILTFKAESNEEVSKNISINARPQNLLKIDMTNYNVGIINGNTYTASSQLSNTLTPGQVGMMVIDIYPEYAQYDQIEIKSGADNKGNKISFIQVVKYGDDYYELRPSSISTDDGILLQRASYTEDISTQTYKFDGKFYVKTLMGSNVDYDQIVTITVIGTTNIRDNNNEIVEIYEITNTMDIIVNQAPSLNLEYDGDENGIIESGYIYNSELESAEEYYLAVPGQTIYFNLNYEKLSLQNLFTQANVVKYNNQEYALNKNDYVNVDKIENNRFSIKIKNNSVGVLISIKVGGDEIVNDYKEGYVSNEIKIMVVDCIISGIDVNNGNDVFEVGQYTKIEAQISATFEENSDIIEILESKINSSSNYWWGIKNRNWNNWNLDASNLPYTNSENKLVYMNWNEYDAYRAGILKKTENDIPSLGIFATKQDSLEKVFKVSIEYYYDAEGSLRIIENQNTAIQSKQFEKIVNMVLKTVTDIENPVPIYTIKEFYDIKNNPDLDYILMTDLYFGLSDETNLDIYEQGTATTDAYSPFALSVKSFDGNMNTIHMYGNMNYDADAENGASLNLGLFTSVEQDTILVNLDVEYNKPTSTFNSDELIEDNVAYNNYALRYNNLKNYSSVFFGGLTSQNKGVISNCQVRINGDIEITLNETNAKVNMAGFASQNSGKITYSSVKGPDWNNNFDNDCNYNSVKADINKKIISYTAGEMAVFVNDNNSLISNCDTEFVGLENRASATLNSKVAGFVAVNGSSGKIINSSVAGQRLSHKFTQKSIELLYPIEKNDVRVSEVSGIQDTSNLYFARIFSLNNVAGFVYDNVGTIENAYAAIPMETQSRSAGFVYDNSNGGIIKTTYTTSIYDDSSEQSSAHTPFTGTNELSEVLNNTQTSVIENSYYLTKIKEIYEEDILFKEPASRIGVNLDGSTPNHSYFVGFDFETIWTNEGLYDSPIIASIEKNNLNRNHFKRTEVEFELDGETIRQFPRSQSGKVPYTIANALQFVNTFNEYATGKDDAVNNVVKRDIRLINDIDLIEYIGTAEFDNIKNVIYIGDFDGNGMSINNIKITGSGNDNRNESLYANVSNSYGLFYQIGSASVVNNSNDTYTLKNIDFQSCNTTIRNLTLNVSEVSSSRSTFTGILAGVIVNTAIKSLTINSSDVDVLGNNAVGGIAGAVIGNSSLHNVNINASVQSTYRKYANNDYVNKEFVDVDIYKNIDYSNVYESGYYSNEIFDLAKYNGERVAYSYAGGIAGIVDIYDTSRSSSVTDQDFAYNKNTKQKVSENWTANINVVKVFGDVSITGEIAGGLFGKINKNTYITNGKFEVSTTNNQVIGGAYVAGGLVGISDAGAINISSVEVNQNSVEEYDTNLTNKTGNNLFTRKNMYPYAIGGLVGIQKGGYLISSFTKTNVVNFSAKYAGGIIGYLTRFDKLTSEAGEIAKEFGGYVLIEEVYTTGNVLASDGYKLSNKKIEICNTNSTDIISVDVYDSMGYAGGVAGYYDASPYDQFNGIVGINAFHAPENYSIIDYDYEAIKIEDGKLSYNTQKQKYNTQKISYSDIATGYFGVRELSTGGQEIRYFSPRIGAIFGKIDSSKLSEEFIYTSNTNTSAVQYNLHTKYVYNSSNITAADCKNNNGKELDWYAYYDDSLVRFSNNLNKYMIIKNANNWTIHINSNITDSNTEYTSGRDTYYSPSNTYLVLKGINYNGIDYSMLYQDDSGQYKGWSENWKYKSPVYPKLKPSNLSVYNTIETEEELLDIRSGGQYIIAKDIYLTRPWNPKYLSNVKLTSAKRDDGLGIYNNYTNSYSIYYAIYNINIYSLNSSNDDSGFFSTLNNSNISNINFVFGTTFADPSFVSTNGESYWKGGDNLGFNVSAKNAGLLIGNLAQNSIISNCNVYLNSGENVNYSINTQSAELEFRNYNYGGLVGNCDNGMGASTIVQNSIYGGIISESISTKRYDYQNNIPKFNAIIKDIDIDNCDIEEINLGGLVGNIIITDLGINLNKVVNLQLSVIRDENTVGSVEITSLNIGGLIGHAISNSLDANKTDYMYIKIDDIMIKTKNAYIGGLVGLNEGVDISNSEFSGDIDINIESTYSASIGGLSGLLTSGANIINCSVNRILEKPNKNFEYFGNIIVSGDYKFLYIGGFIGEIKLGTVTVENSKSIFNSIYINGNYINAENRVYIGGFIGAVSHEEEHLITNCLSMGDIEYIPSAASCTYCSVAGFVACGSNGGSDQTGNIKIDYCISNVDIKIDDINNVNYPLLISGFAGPNIKSIKNSISLGSILCDEIIDNTSCYFAGFANNRNSNGLITNCYSYTSLKLITKKYGDASKSIYYITATSFNEYDVIYYNYNVSGFEGNTNFGIDETYAEMIGRKNNTQLLLKNILYDSSKNFLKEYSYIATLGKVDFTKGEDDVDVKIFFGRDDSYPDYVGYGSKVYPFAINNQDDADMYLINMNNKTDTYFLLNSSVILSGSISDLQANLISNDSNVASTVYLTKTINVEENAMIAGIELCPRQLNAMINSIIGTNNGYIFNTVSSGRILATKRTQEMSGFVIINNGVINSCLSMTYIEADDKIVSTAGFVFENNGIISRSEATNVFYNLSSNIEVTHSGFANKLHDFNKIFNCFAAPSMFNIDIQDEEEMLFTNIYGFNKNMEEYCQEFTLSNITNNSDINYYNCNCVLDISSIGELDSYPFNSVTNIIEYYYGDDAYLVTEDMFDKDSGVNSYSYNSDDTTPTANSINYGYATPTLFKKTTAFDSEQSFSKTTYYAGLDGDKDTIDFATYSTGDNTADNPYKINHIERYKWLMDMVDENALDNNNRRTIYLQLVNDINCQNRVENTYIGGKIWINTDGSIYNINNKNTRSFYNLIIDSDMWLDYSIRLRSISLISANKVDLYNFGVIGRFKEMDWNKLPSMYSMVQIESASLVVGYAVDFNATNCFAIYNQDNFIVKNVKNFGLLIGLATGMGKISNCFALGNLIIAENESYLDKYVIVGMLAGNLGKYIVEDCFTTGTLDVRRYNNKDQNSYIGGLYGNVSRPCVNLDNDIIYDTVIGMYFKNKKLEILSGYFDLLPNVRNNYSLVSIFNTKNFVKTDAIGHSNVSTSVDSYNTFYYKGKMTTLISEIGSLDSDGLIAKTFRYNDSDISKTIEIDNISTGKNYYNEGISLCQSDSGASNSEELSIKEMFTNLTDKLKIVISKSGRVYETKMFQDSQYHFSIQKSFVNNKIVSKWLKISDTEITGSKMSPLEVNSLSIVNDSSKHYYLTQSFTNIRISQKLSAKMFVADYFINSDNIKNYYYITSIPTGTPLFNNFEEGSIVSMLTLTNRPLVEEFIGYAYKVTIDGSFTNNDGYVFAKVAKSPAVFHTCTTNVILTVNADVFNSNKANYQNSISTFVKYTDYYGSVLSGNASNYFHNITSTNTISLNGIEGVDCDVSISGIAYSYAPYTMSGFNNISLKVQYDRSLIEFNKNVFIGGLTGEVYKKVYFDQGTIIQINDFDVDINYPSYNDSDAYGDNDNEEKALHLGGLFGYTNIQIDLNNTIVQYSSYFKVTNSYNTNSQGLRNRSYIGGIIGSMDVYGLIDKVNISGTLFIENYSENNVCYVGGIAGFGKGDTYRDGNGISNVTSDVNLYVRIKTERSTCYVGGIVGVANIIRLENITNTGAVVAVSDATRKSIYQYKYYNDIDHDVIYNPNSDSDNLILRSGATRGPESDDPIPGGGSTYNDHGGLIFTRIYYPLPNNIISDPRNKSTNVSLAVGGICGYYNSTYTLPKNIYINNFNNAVIGLMTNNDAVCYVGGFAGLAYLNDYYKDYGFKGRARDGSWKTSSSYNFASIVDNSYYTPGTHDYIEINKIYPDFDCQVATHYVRYWAVPPYGPRVRSYRDTDTKLYGYSSTSSYYYYLLNLYIADTDDGFARYNGRSGETKLSADNAMYNDDVYNQKMAFAGTIIDGIITNCSYFGKEGNTYVGKSQAGYFYGAMVRDGDCDFYNGTKLIIKPTIPFIV